MNLLICSTGCSVTHCDVSICRQIVADQYDGLLCSMTVDPSGTSCTAVVLAATALCGHPPRGDHAGRLPAGLFRIMQPKVLSVVMFPFLPDLSNRPHYAWADVALALLANAGCGKRAAGAAPETTGCLAWPGAAAWPK